MKKRKIVLFSAILVLLLTIFTVIHVVNRDTITNKKIKIADVSDAFKNWLNLPEEERNKIKKPLAYEVNANKDKNVAESIKTNVQKSTIQNLENISKYDLRDYNGVKPVKNQRQWGFCWAFAGTSALESHLLNESRNSIYDNCTSLDYDLNPMHVGYALADYFKYDINNLYGNKPLGGEGNNIDNVLYWTSGIGPVSTEKFNITSENEPKYIAANEIMVQTEDIQVDNAIFFPRVDMISEETSTELKESQIKLIKQTIMEDGALAFGSMAPVKGLSGYNESTYSVYTESMEEMWRASHMMLIVGWDDNYSKENFNNGSITQEKPCMDGAWIVQNSWGTGKEGLGVNQSGYYYYSYLDFNLNSDELFSLAKTSTKDYDNIYQYNSVGDGRGIINANGKYAATIFDRKDNEEELTEIGFYNFYPNTTYGIYINSENDSLNFEDFEYVKNVKDTNSFSEYFNIKLDEPIKLTGEKFTIIIKVENKNEEYNIPVLFESPYNDLVETKENCSFLSYDGKDWYDLKQDEASLFVKAFTRNSSENSEITIESDLDKDTVYLKGTEEGILLTSTTTNIKEKELLTYKIKDAEEEDKTDKFIINTSSNNNLYYANIVIPFDYNLIDEYKIEILYNGEVKEICDFKIEKKLITSINILKEEMYLNINKTAKIKPRLEIEPQEILNPYIGYICEDESIVTVDENGIISAKKEGETTIKVKALDGSNITSEKKIKLKVVDLSKELEGTGTEENPYIITNAEELNLIKSDLSANYKLNNDIDLTEETTKGGSLYNNGQGWEPIGFLQKREDITNQEMEEARVGNIATWITFDNSEAFTGTLDGNDKKIEGLYINRPDKNGVALFEIIRNGTVKNLKIRNSQIIGNYYVASFAAVCTNGAKLENVSSNGKINCKSYSGGIVAIETNDSIIEKAYNLGEIKIESKMHESSEEKSIGGIVGACWNSKVNSTYNEGNIISDSGANLGDTGGIVGILYGTVDDICNLGNIKIGSSSGGIIGRIVLRGEIHNAYNMGNISVWSDFNYNSVHDIVGELLFVDEMKIYNVYALESNLETIGRYDEEDENIEVDIKKKSLEELKEQSTFTDWDFTEIWKIEEGETPTIRIDDSTELEGLIINSYPSKTEFIVNRDEFQTEGLQVSLLYKNGKQEKINLEDCIITGFDNSILGEQVITIDYNEIVAKYKIRIQKVQITSLGFSNFNSYYTEGDMLNTEDIKIYVQYNNDDFKEIDIEDCIISKTGPLETSDDSIKFSYTEDNITITVNYHITVYPKKINGLEGEGSKEKPYLISTPEELNRIRENPLLEYRIVNDIDMTDILKEGGALYDNNKGWKPIDNFQGTLDGNYNTIKGLYINRAGEAQVYEDYVSNGAGLFSSITHAEIKNLTISDANIISDASAGFVYNSYASDKKSKLYNLCIKDSIIKGKYSVAGILAKASNNDEFECCSAINCTIESTYDGESKQIGTGGIVGVGSYKMILKNLYNTSNVKGGYYIGGICGVCESQSDLEELYNIGEIEGDGNKGGICGYKNLSYNEEEDKILNCYDIGDLISPIGKVEGCIERTLSIKEKTLEELKMENTFEGFDFENVWQIKANETPSFKKEKYLKSIEIENEPQKIEYIEETKLDITGLKVIAKYSDNSQKEVNDFNVKNDIGEDLIGNDAIELSINDSYINIIYEEDNITKKIKQSITVNEKKIISIIKEKEPNKIIYLEGENFSKQGLKVGALYDNRKEEPIFEYTVTNEKGEYLIGENRVPLKNEDKFVNINYAEFTIKQAITVNKEIDLADLEIIEYNGEKYIKNIPVGSTVQNIQEKINKTIEVYNISNKKLNDTDKIGTGSTIKVLNGSEVVDEYNISIKGDIDGTGTIDIYDILQLIDLVFDNDSSYVWNECTKLAGKCVEGSETENPDLYDILRLIEYHFDNVKW